ncbi:uncharacterized protein LOC111700058 [Eurytemora carolleeae]|uniref:uncharacterized protein LOC111700058 n=1 Tax=Eurytemora carolleeae TaxID=1294199 RepID=UPI000C774D13|nr:uncharacterized protein LOC111700058 [Eurytemora carolleeae]|eukprot:XP_023326644.1 uncharacterized protein LOC111700058 [Eurytemora affinis]
MEEEVSQTNTFCELLNTGCSSTVTSLDVEKGLKKAAEDTTGKLSEICTEPGLYRRRTQSTVRFCRSPPNIRKHIPSGTTKLFLSNYDVEYHSSDGKCFYAEL